MKRIIPAILFFALLSTFAIGQNASFSGTVSDGGEPQANALVSFIHNVFATSEDTSFTYTDEDGYYSFDVEVETINEADTSRIWTEICPEFSITTRLDNLIEGDTTINLTCEEGIIPIVLNIGGVASNDEESNWYFMNAINAPVDNYLWTINGETFTEPYVYYEFEEAGEYIINLTVETTDNETYTSSLTINAGAGTAPNCEALFFPIADSLPDDAIYYVNSSLGSNLTYVWDFGDGTSSTEAYPTHTFAEDNIDYTVCLTITGDDCSEEFCLTVNGGLDGSGRIGSGIKVQHDLSKAEGFDFIVIPVSSGSVGLNERDMNIDMKIFPNPSSGAINLEIAQTIEEDGAISITDLTGKIVFEKNITANTNLRMIPLSLEDLATGTYIIQIRTESYFGIKKLVLQR